MDVAGADYPAAYGGKPTTPIQGKSLAPALRGELRVPHDWLYFQFSNNRAIRRGDWKAVSARGGRWELYNLKDDRTELNDLAERPPEQVAELSELWHRVAETVDEAPGNLRRPAGDKVLSFPASSMTPRAAGPKPPAEQGKEKRGKRKAKQRP